MARKKAKPILAVVAGILVLLLIAGGLILFALNPKRESAVFGNNDATVSNAQLNKISETPTSYIYEYTFDIAAHKGDCDAQTEWLFNKGVVGTYLSPGSAAITDDNSWPNRFSQKSDATGQSYGDGFIQEDKKFTAVAYLGPLTAIANPCNDRESSNVVATAEITESFCQAGQSSLGSRYFSCQFDGAYKIRDANGNPVAGHLAGSATGKATVEILKEGIQCTQTQTSLCGEGYSCSNGVCQAHVTDFQPIATKPSDGDQLNGVTPNQPSTTQPKTTQPSAGSAAAQNQTSNQTSTGGDTSESGIDLQNLDYKKIGGIAVAVLLGILLIVAIIAGLAFRRRK